MLSHMGLAKDPHPAAYCEVVSIVREDDETNLATQASCNTSPLNTATEEDLMKENVNESPAQGVVSPSRTLALLIIPLCLLSNTRVSRYTIPNTPTVIRA